MDARLTEANLLLAELEEEGGNERRRDGRTDEDREREVRMGEGRTERKEVEKKKERRKE